MASALLLYSKGNTRWMLGLFQVDSVVHRQPAEYHISFRIHEDDVDGMISYLERQGIEPVHPPGCSTTRTDARTYSPWLVACCIGLLQGPDGHLLELIADLSDAPRPDFNYRPLSEWRTLVKTRRKDRRRA